MFWGCCGAGSVVAPLAGGIIVFGNSAVIIGLWPAHFLWTYYCVAEYSVLPFFFSFYIVLYSLIYQVHIFIFYICLWASVIYFRTKRVGLFLKILGLISLPLPLLLWPILAIFGSLLGGLGYGFFAPLVATFEAVGETTTDKFFHCFIVSQSFPFSSTSVS